MKKLFEQPLLNFEKNDFSKPGFRKFRNTKHFKCRSEYSFIQFPARFSSREGHEGSSPRRTRNTSRSTAVLGIFLLAPHQDGTKHGWRCNHSTWSLGEAGISRFGGEVVQHSRLCEFHGCALCREVSHRGILAEIPFLALVLEIILFQS